MHNLLHSLSDQFYCKLSSSWQRLWSTQLKNITYKLCATSVLSAIKDHLWYLYKNNSFWVLLIMIPVNRSKLSCWCFKSGFPKFGQVNRLGAMTDTQVDTSRKEVRGEFMNSKWAIGGKEAIKLCREKY